MTLMNSLVFILVLALVAWLAWWIITHFFPAPARTPVLLIVGVILLLILLSQFIPGVANLPLWPRR
jgi:hypothetical protein